MSVMKLLYKKEEHLKESGMLRKRIRNRDRKKPLSDQQHLSGKPVKYSPTITNKIAVPIQDSSHIGRPIKFRCLVLIVSSKLTPVLITEVFGTHSQSVYLGKAFNNEIKRFSSVAWNADLHCLAHHNVIFIQWDNGNFRCC